MTRAYPIVLTPDLKGYVVSVPDLNINTQGDNLPEALYMARDAIGAWGICRQDAGKAIPEPSKTVPCHEEDELVSWVDIDFDKYRRLNSLTAEKISEKLLTLAYVFTGILAYTFTGITDKIKKSLIYYSAD
ncbi:MAG: type II toxin-antitoxin system HicB family antitoxin [Oscillospiraceae bacterium]|nr:type II toxin-antitoxin system HicB family antitoxin [Oscillospiraceae bacterium]